MNGVSAYGHGGRPVLAFPVERGHARDFEDRGMVHAIGELLAAGRVKLYCVDLRGRDVPHDWPSWRRQLAHHLPRFC